MLLIGENVNKWAGIQLKVQIGMCIQQGTSWHAHTVQQGTSWHAHTVQQGTSGMCVQLDTSWHAHTVQQGTSWHAHTVQQGTSGMCVQLDTSWHVQQQRFISVCASTQSDQSLSFPPEETLDPWLPIEWPSKTLFRLFDTQTDLSLRWAQMPTFAGYQLKWSAWLFGSHRQNYFRVKV